MVRQLRSVDSIARGSEARLAKNGAIVLAGEKDADKDDEVDDGASDAADKLDERFLPKVESPVYNMAYGQMLMVSKSFTSAISESRFVSSLASHQLTVHRSLPSPRL